MLMKLGHGTVIVFDDGLLSGCFSFTILYFTHFIYPVLSMESCIIEVIFSYLAYYGILPCCYCYFIEHFICMNHRLVQILVWMGWTSTHWLNSPKTKIHFIMDWYCVHWDSIGGFYLVICWIDLMEDLVWWI